MGTTQPGADNALDLDKLEALARAADTDIAACARFTTTFDPAGVLALIALARRAAQPVEPADQQSDEPDAASEWRRLALQFDGHRIKALSHLRCLLAFPNDHAQVAREFLAAPPLSGEAVLAERIAALATHPFEPAVPALTPLDYRAQGREEALQIILAESAEEPFANCTNNVPNGDSGDYSGEWDEDKLRALLNISDRKHDAFARAEAAYWDALGDKEEAKREMLMVEQAPFYKPLHDFLSKHEAWDLMGELKRAAEPAVPAVGGERSYSEGYEDGERSGRAAIEIHNDAMAENRHYRERVFNQILELDAKDGLARFARVGAVGGEIVVSADREEFMRQVLESVCEIPDRDSPEGQPEMCLVTTDELKDIMISAFERIDEDAELAAPAGALVAKDEPFGIYVERDDGTTEFQRTGKPFSPTAQGYKFWTLYTAPTGSAAAPAKASKLLAELRAWASGDVGISRRDELLTDKGEGK